MKKQKGFTLIELLVVTTIILVLMGIAVVSYQAAQRKSRDSKRKADLEQVRAALEMYRSDQEVYPSTSTWATMISALTTGKYLSTTPTDPKGYNYYYTSGGASYTLCAKVEGETGNGCTGNPSCGSSITCNYSVTNP